MKNILVPVSSVQTAITNLRYAVNLASINGANVYLVHLYKEFSRVGTLTKVNQLIIEDSEELLNKVLQEVDTKGVTVTAKALKGDLYDGIVRISDNLAIDLIVISPQSVEIADEVYLGSVTGKLVKKTKTPVLIVPKDYIFRKIESILLAFKRGYLEDAGALDSLKEIARSFSAKINLLQVITPDVAKEEAVPDPALKALNANIQTTQNATIYQGILEHFQSNNPDMLCVFRRKRGGFEKIWEKNTILKKDFHTTKPLLVLKA